MAFGGIFLFILLRFDYGRFYHALGVSPEEVGLSESEILIRSATGYMIVLLASGVFILAGIVLYVVLSTLLLVLVLLVPFTLLVIAQRPTRTVVRLLQRRFALKTISRLFMFLAVAFNVTGVLVVFYAGIFHNESSAPWAVPVGYGFMLLALVLTREASPNNQWLPFRIPIPVELRGQHIQGNLRSRIQPHWLYYSAWSKKAGAAVFSFRQHRDLHDPGRSDARSLAPAHSAGSR